MRFPASILPALALAACAGAAAADEPVAPLTSVSDAYPHMKPDGSALLFQSNRTGRWALWLAKPDGTDPRVLLDSGDDPVTATWSPDGARIAFAATVDGQSDVFVMNADASGRRRLTDDPGDDSHPHWSADGTRIFFNSARTTPDRAADWSAQWHEVFSMAPDGAELRQHTRCRAVCTYPVPSPDGRRIVYRKVVAGPGLQWDLTSIPRNSDVFVADADGANEVNVSANGAFDGWPMWSPDGTRIAFSSNRDGPAYAAALFVVAPDGTGLARVTPRDGAAYVQASWLPDGKSLVAYRAFESAQGEYGQVVRVAAP